jgi:vitamin B12 transporter
VTILKTTAAAIALLPLFSVNLAFAQIADKSESGHDNDDIWSAANIRHDYIVTATRSEVFPEESGLAITLVNERDLRRLQSPSLADVLVRTPGVTVSRNGGIGTTTALRIRGAEGDQTLTLIDGVRVNDPSSPGGGFDFGNLLVGNITRVEVLRGPNSVPWGSQALGGIVNVVTQTPTQTLSANARAEYGSDDTRNLVGSIGGGFGPVRISAGGGYFKSDGISAFKNGTERDGYRQYAANGRIGIDLSDNFDLDFRSYYANSKTQLDGFPPPFFGFADTAEYSTAEQLTAYAGANLRLADDQFKNRIAFTLTDINRDNFASPAATSPSFLAKGRVERIEYQGVLEISDQFRTVFGAEHERSGFNDGFSTTKTNATSGYGQIIASFSDELTLTGGARVDDYKTYKTKLTFSANAAWRPSYNTVIRAAYGEGFKAPTLFQLFSFFGNNTLNPETAKSYEIGIEQKAQNGTVTFGLTAFQRNTRNQIDYISCFGQTTGICTNRPFGTYDNVDRARAKGIELSIKARPSDTLTLEANYSLIDSKDRTTGLTLLRRPKHSVNFAVDWEAADWLKLGASLHSVSDSADNDFQTFTRTSLDSYTLASFRAAVPLGERFELYGRVENLFDTAYETVSGYGTQGRKAHVGVRAKF